MKTALLKLISYVALAGTIIPSLLVFFTGLDQQANKYIMAIAMLVWFGTAPFWINKKSEEEVTE